MTFCLSMRDIERQTDNNAAQTGKHKASRATVSHWATGPLGPSSGFPNN